MAWKPEFIADRSGTWTGNAMRFASKDEAERYARDLASRWTLVTSLRTTECDDVVNYTLSADGKLEPVMVNEKTS